MIDLPNVGSTAQTRGLVLNMISAECSGSKVRQTWQRDDPVTSHHRSLLRGVYKIPNAAMRDQARVLANAYRFCRSREIRFDTVKPSCGSCVSLNCHCMYLIKAPKRRPATAMTHALQDEKRAIENFIVSLKTRMAD